MRPETKQLIQEKLHRWLEGEQTHAIDPNGTWINVRDVRSIIDCETELLKKTIEKLKYQNSENYYRSQDMTSYPHPDILTNENNSTALMEQLKAADEAIENLREQWGPMLMLRHPVFKVFFGDYDKLKKDAE